MKIFLEAAHFGSFTYAAERLGLTQSAVSVSIKKLEEKHNVLLFDRSGRRLVLTEAGQVLLGEAERILRDVELTVRRVESRRANDQHTLVACTSHAYDFWMPELSVRIGIEDRLQLDLVRGNLDDVASWVMRGTADVGITNVIPSHPQFRQVRVFEERLILCGSRERAQAISSSLTWAELFEQSPLLWEQSDLTPTLINALSAHRINVDQVAHPGLRLSSTMAVISALCGGAHIGFIPERAAVPYLASGHLSQIGKVEVPVPYWMFSLREREIEPLAVRLAKAVNVRSSIDEKEELVVLHRK